MDPAEFNESTESNMSCEFSLNIHNRHLPLNPVRSSRIQWIHWIYHILVSFISYREIYLGWFNGSIGSCWILLHSEALADYKDLHLPLGLIRCSRIQWIHWIYHVLDIFTMPASETSMIQQDPIDPLNLPCPQTFYWIYTIKTCLWIQ